MISVLINDTVKKFLLKQPRDTRKRIREKFEFLESGIWDGGLKVKKLKGTSSKFVFEARIDRGNRILFTLGGEPARRDAEESENRMMVYVWGIVVHDDISRISRTIIPTNAPFLEFSEYEEAGFDNVDMEELGKDYFTQEGIADQVSSDSGSQRWYSLDEPEWQRIQLYTRDDFDLFLHLTPEQDEILSTPLPLMISGTAGSGKTSLAVYYLLNRNLNQKKKLFITYNVHLKNFARKLYNGLLNEREWKSEVMLPDFYTFKELCLEVTGKERFPAEKEIDYNLFKHLFTSYPNYHSYDAALVWEEIRAIIKGAVPRVNLPVLEKAVGQFKKGSVSAGVMKQLQEQFIRFSKLESFQKVDKLVQKYLKIDIGTFAAGIQKYLQPGSVNEREKESVALILEKTLDTLVKLKEETGRKYLSFPEYEMLGKKKAPNFQFNRGEIYRIFEWYLDRVESGGLWDELDMMPETVDDKFTYDILVCDEVQDLTDTQLNLLFNFVKNPKNMFLAGDIRQTVNPSGFRWEEVRKHFYERGLEVPGLKNLSLNFRSSGSIIELSNILLELKEKFTGRESYQPREEWKYKGRPVTVVSGIDEDDMLRILKEAGADRTVLVRTETEKDALKEQLGTELVFTIREAKGLEFDTVVLWKFCDDADTSSESVDVWKVTLDMSGRNIHEARIKHEISLLYVGITRCQKDLIVYDGRKPSVIWESELLKDNVYITDDRRYLRQVWDVVSSPEEWAGQGHYFFERGYFKAAAECFRNGGDEPNMAKAHALYYEQTGDYEKAAQNYKAVGQTETAAINYEKAGKFREALSLWEALGDGPRVSQCRAALLEEEGEFREAGQLYLENKQYEAAVECFKRVNNDRAVADIYLNHLNNIEKAAEYYESCRDYETAAGLYARLEWYDKAAELYFRIKDYARAEVLWEKTNSKGNLLELYRRTGKHDKVLVIYEEEDNLDKAVRYLKSLGEDTGVLVKEGEELFEQGRYYQALIRFLVVHESGPVPAEIADCYYRMGNFETAISYYEQAGDPYTAARVYEETGDHENAFKMYFGSGRDKESRFARSLEVLEKLRHRSFLRPLALNYFFARDYERALFLFVRLDGFEALEGFCYAEEGLREKVLERWEQCRTIGEFIIIAEGCIERDLVYLGAEFFLALPFRADPLWTPRFYPELEYKTGIFEDRTFCIPLTKTTVMEMLRIHFLDRPADLEAKKKEDKAAAEIRTREMNTWGHFLMAADTAFKNVSLVRHYLELSGDYNDLVRYYMKIRQVDPALFIEEAALMDKNSSGSAYGTKNDEVQAFKILMREWAGASVQKDFDNINAWLSRTVLRENNYLLFTVGSASEENRKKAVDWCTENGFIEDFKSFLFPSPTPPIAEET